MDITDFTKSNSDYEYDFENVSEEIDESIQEIKSPLEEEKQKDKDNEIVVHEIKQVVEILNETKEQPRSTQLTKEEQDYINQQVQEQELMDLGKTTHLIETNKNDFNQNYEGYQKIINDLNINPPEKCSPDNFDINQIKNYTLNRTN